MFDFLKRGRLIKRGLASRKTRRRRVGSELMRNLENSPYVKVLVFALFAGGLAFLVFSGKQPEPTKNFVIALLVLATAITQLWINQPKSFSQNSRILLVFSVILVQLAVTKLLLVICNSGNYRFLKPEMAGLITPYAFAPLVLSVLLGRQHGLYAAFFVSLWGSMLFGPIDAPLLITSLISGFTAVSLTLQVRRRSKLIRAGFYVGLAIWLLSLTFGLIGPINWFYPTANDWGMIGWQSALAIGNGIVTATIVGGALPMLENLFGITTDISWLEASDLNHPLLRQMTIEAPGTYHHSLVVANLAEAAAEAIGANATLCRVCAYFHDVGKLGLRGQPPWSTRRSRLHGQHIDTLRVQLGPQCVGEDERKRFAGGVHGQLRGPDVSRERRHEDHATVPAADHRRRQRLHQTKRRPAVDVHHRVALRGLELEKRCDGAHRGIVDEQADAGIGALCAQHGDEIRPGKLHGDRHRLYAVPRVDLIGEGAQ